MSSLETGRFFSQENTSKGHKGPINVHFLHINKVSRKNHASKE